MRLLELIRLVDGRHRLNTPVGLHGARSDQQLNQQLYAPAQRKLHRRAPRGLRIGPGHSASITRIVLRTYVRSTGQPFKLQARQ